MKKYIVIALILSLFLVPNTFAQSANAGAAAGSSATANPTINFNSSTDPALGNAALEAADNPNAYRGYNMVGNIPNVPLISHFGPRSASGGFKTVPELLTYAWLFTEGALEKIASGEADFSQVNAEKNFPKAGVMKDGQRWIAIVLETREIIEKDGKKVPGAPIPFMFKDKDGKMKRAAFRGWANSYAMDEETKMQNTLAAGALAALKKGCNVYQVTDEGASIDTQSRGWTIGLYSSVGYMPSGQNQAYSTVSGVGAAYGKSTAGMRDKPWVNGNGLVVPDFVMEQWIATTSTDDWVKEPAPAPAPKAEVKAEPAQTGNHIPKKQ